MLICLSCFPLTVNLSDENNLLSFEHIFAAKIGV